MLPDERLELADELVLAAEAQLGLDPVLESGEPELLEPRDLALREGVVTKVGQRGAPPQGQGLDEQLRRLAVGLPAERRGPFVDEPLEPVCIELIRLHAQPVGAALGLQAVGDELSDLRDVNLERVGSRRGRLVAPQVVDQLFGRDRLVPVQEEETEQGARLAALGGGHRTVLIDLEGAEDPEFHCCFVMIVRFLQVVFSPSWKHRRRTRKRAASSRCEAVRPTGGMFAREVIRGGSRE